MSHPLEGQCNHCRHRFSYSLIHTGFNDSAYAYCDSCGMTGFMSSRRPDIPAAAHFKAHGPISREMEALLAPCPCEGKFRHNAAPRCLLCYKALSAAAATRWIEEQAAGTAKGWRWQHSWTAAYAIIIEGKSHRLDFTS